MSIFSILAICTVGISFSTQNAFAGPTVETVTIDSPSNGDFLNTAIISILYSLGGLNDGTSYQATTSNLAGDICIGPIWLQGTDPVPSLICPANFAASGDGPQTVPVTVREDPAGANTCSASDNVTFTIDTTASILQSALITGPNEFTLVWDEPTFDNEDGNENPYEFFQIDGEGSARNIVSGIPTTPALTHVIIFDGAPVGLDATATVDINTCIICTIVDEAGNVAFTTSAIIVDGQAGGSAIMDFEAAS